MKRFPSLLCALTLASILLPSTGWETPRPNPQLADGTDTVMLMDTGPDVGGSNSPSTSAALPNSSSLTASFTATPSSGQAPLTITFNDTSTGPITGDKTWDFGDGTTTNISSTTTNITHVYSNANVVVTLTVSDSLGSATAINFVPVIAAPVTGGWFTNTYAVYGNSNIVVSPATSVGIFYVGDAVTISNTLGTTVEVYDYHFNHVTNLAPPAIITGLGIGHYFVQVNGTNGVTGDRAQFSVLPRGYTNSPHSDIGSLLNGAPYEYARLIRVATGFTRQVFNWTDLTTDGVAYAWSKSDAFIQDATSFFGHGYSIPTKILGVTPAHLELYPPTAPGNMGSPVVDDTNSLNSWVQDVSLLYSNVALHYTNAVVYEVLNEPNPFGIVFTNAADSWITPSWPDVSVPASMAVRAAAHAIKYVCPKCQVWAPAALGITGGESYILTNSFVPRYYREVDAISYHLGTTLGPVDSLRHYFTPMDKSGGLALDTAYKRIHRLYHNKPLVVTECYPAAPDDLGKINPWYTLEVGYGGGNGPWSVPQLSWDWRLMTDRFLKCIIMGKGMRHIGLLHWLSLVNGNLVSLQGLVNAYYQADGYPNDFYGWDVNSEDYDFTGCGPKPTVDGQAMLSWWLNGSVPIRHWLSGTPLIVDSPSGELRNGCIPGLHFWEFKFRDGTKNTFIWADEGCSFKTNFGVALTDIYSNSWRGAIGSEPVIAWGWNHRKRL
jgi:PKD repeat protein